MKRNEIEWAAPESKGIMKHKSLLAWFAIAAIVVLSVFAGQYLNSHSDNDTIPEGSYGLQDIEYLTPISSSTRDYFLEKNQGTIFTFYDDQFYVDATTGAIGASILDQSFTKVTYEEIPLGNQLKLTNGVNEGIDLSKFTKKRAFRIFSKEIDTGFTLYRLDDQVWLSYMNSDSVLKYAEYLFSLQVDELQNQSANEILNLLLAKEYPISEPTLFKEEKDSNGLKGISNGYISKAEWIDSRGSKPASCHVTVQVFKSPTDCELRKDSLENLYAYMSSDGYYFFSEASVLITVQKGLTENQAELYSYTLQAIRSGELSKYNGVD